MDKIWYIYIKGQTEGPFSFDDLKQDIRLSPDTFVWRQGFEGWKRIRDVIELAELFEEKEEPPIDEESQETGFSSSMNDELVADFGDEPPYLFWLFVVLAVMLYVLFYLYWWP